MFALSPSDMWALLRSDARSNPVYIEHFDGTAWNQIANPGGAGSTFQASVLLATSDSNVWVIGESLTGLAVWQYNGTAWTNESPALPPSAEPSSAVLDSNGDLYIAANNFVTDLGLIWEHVGTHWTDLTPQAPLQSYTALSLTRSGTLIAAGSSATIQELSAGTWTSITVPRTSAYLSDVKTAPDGTVFATGQGDGKPIFVEIKPAASTAKVFPVSAPVPAATGDSATLAVAGPSDVWLFNAYSNGQSHPWIAHFDGQQVIRASAPAFGSNDPALTGGMTLGSAVLAYGSMNGASGTPSPKLLELCPIEVQDPSITPSAETLPLGAQTFWSVPTAAQKAGNLVSPGLFSTGKLPPGSSFEYSFFAAGTYSVHDKTSGSTSTVHVRPAIAPASGEPGTVFRITVAKAAAPLHYTYRVLIKRPRSARYVTLTATTHQAISFIPDAGAGKYGFEVELKTQSGTTAPSPPVTATVSQ